MAINSIQLPDNTTQDIHDARLSSISELSIDSTPTANSNNLVKSGGVYSALSGKQDTIVFNTTYNASSNKAATMSDVPNVFIAEAQTTTYAAIDAAYNRGDIIYCTDSAETLYHLQGWIGSGEESGNSYLFCSFDNLSNTLCCWLIYDSDEWESYDRYVSNFNGSYNSLTNKPTIPTVPTIVTDIAANKTSTTTTASPSAVYNEVHPTIATTQPSGGFLPNVVYDLGTLTGTVTFALASATDNTIANPYHWTFETSSTAPTITWPANITWAGGSAPTISASKHYEILIRKGYGTSLEF